MTKRNIVHIEIPSSNLKVSGDFYSRLFGWQITHDDTMNYSMWEPGEGPGGGFSRVPEDVQVGEVLLHVNSDDLEADLKMVTSLGGTIVRPVTEIPTIGWYAVFKDPTGNMISLFKSLNPAM